MDALDFADAADAARAFADLDTRAYRPFNMVLADNRDAYVVCHRGDNPTKSDAGPTNRPIVVSVPSGLHMLTAFDLDQVEDHRIARHRPLFAAAAVPRP
ncbi:hypothetical protein JZU57_01080, partial [bacterium]|nr:hypothetical protein [bacterium]